MRKNTIKDKIKDLPRTPGVYKFLDGAGDVIYIGKAKNLRNRAGSYFVNQDTLGPKTALMVNTVKDIDYIEVGSEIEAVILEAYLIKEFLPRYNINLKDDKSFLYIEILESRDGGPDSESSNFPRVKVSRKSDLLSESTKFGPFPSSSAARYVMRTLRKFIPYRDCTKGKFQKHKRIGRPCLYGDIGLCPFPCIEGISPDGYKENLDEISLFLSGKSSQIISEIENKMVNASNVKDYEKAKYYRDLLNKFNYVRERRVPAEYYANKPDLLEDLAKEALESLVDIVPEMEKIPSRIECYDVSDLAGSDSVGGMVVSMKGKIDKSFYRRFNLQEGKRDDSQRLAEMISRRLDKIGSAGWEKPDLILLDGGKPQLTAIRKVFKEKDIKDVFLMGLAKKDEILIYFDGNRYKEICLYPDNEGLNHLKELRDEAHRFARSYHHKIRLRNLLDQT